MARYNHFTYGNGTKYGQRAPQNSLSWVLQVDWDNDGIFNGDNEAERMKSLLLRRGRENYVRSDGSGFEDVRAGTVTIILDNSDGRYDPYNSGSPIYPYVRPGVKCYLWVQDDLDWTRYNVFYGYINDIQPKGGIDEQVRMEIVDGITILSQQDIQDVLYENLLVADAIAMILSSCGWDGGSVIEDNKDTLPYWWTMDKKGWQAIDELCNAFLGRAFVDVDGKLRFYSRHHIGTPEMTLTQDKLLKEIVIPQPWEVVRNRIYVTARPRKRYDGVEIWRMQDVVYLGAGDSVEIWANYTYNNESVPASDVITPVATTDYLANSASDGTGSDLTSSFSVTMTAFSAAAKLTVTNNGSNSGYITFLRLRGNALSSINTTTILREDTSSQNLYQIRTMRLDNEMIQDTNMAIDFAGFLRNKLSSPIKYPMIEVEGRANIQFALDLFDTVTLTVSAKAIDGDYDIAYVEHNWMDEGGNAVRTRFILEPTEDFSGYWMFTTQIGISSVFAY